MTQEADQHCAHTVSFCCPLKKPFTPQVSGFMLCPKGFYRLKKVCFSGGRYEKKKKETGSA